jgi:mono/diheme cytochrome c family protein
MNIHSFSAKNIALTSVVAAMLAFSSCKRDPLSPGVEYMPDMYRSPSYEAYGENGIYKDGMAARKPVTGTVSRGYSVTGDVPFNINNIPYAYPNTNEGYEKAGAELKNPLAKNALNIERGKAVYTTFCVHCHGAEGKGDGTIVANGKFPGPPPSYSGPLKNLPEGKIFHVVTYGKGLMGSHASQINKEDRWKVAMYVQQLQHLGEATATSDSTSTTTASSDTASAHAAKPADNKESKK